MDRFGDAARPIDVLCVDIVERYHAALQRELPAIRDALSGLCALSDGAALGEVRLAFDQLADQIEGHLAKEEHLLFPAITALAIADREGHRRPPSPFVALVHPIRMMEAEHLRIEEAMDRLRDLTLEVGDPDALLPGWHRCLAALAHLDRDLTELHHLEGGQLFPRALVLEERVPV